MPRRIRDDHEPCTGFNSGCRNPRRPRNGEGAFEHYDELPRLELDGERRTILVGDYGGLSPPPGATPSMSGWSSALRAPVRCSPFVRTTSTR